jgi:hypothetical protein
MSGTEMVGRDDKGEMVFTPVPMLKVMVLGPKPVVFEFKIACRREPGPLSLVFVTVNVSASAGCTPAPPTHIPSSSITLAQNERVLLMSVSFPDDSIFQDGRGQEGSQPLLAEAVQRAKPCWALYRDLQGRVYFKKGAKAKGWHWERHDCRWHEERDGRKAIPFFVTLLLSQRPARYWPCR